MHRTRESEIKRRAMDEFRKKAPKGDKRPWEPSMGRLVENLSHYSIHGVGAES
jgi:hypothetical protein